MRSYYRGHAGPEVDQHLEDVARRFAAAGATVAEAEMPGDAATLRAWGDPVMQHEAAEAHARLYAAFGSQYRTSIRTLVEAGQKVSDDAYQAGREAIAPHARGHRRGAAGLRRAAAAGRARHGARQHRDDRPGHLLRPRQLHRPARDQPAQRPRRQRPAARRPAHGRPPRRSPLLRAAAWAEAILNFTASADIAP